MTRVTPLADRLRPTPRELDVGRLVAEGLMNLEITDHLGIGESSVKMHLTNLMRKLNVTSRLHLFRRMVEEGLVECPCGHEPLVVINGRRYAPEAPARPA